MDIDVILKTFMRDRLAVTSYHGDVPTGGYLVDMPGCDEAVHVADFAEPDLLDYLKLYAPMLYTGANLYLTVRQLGDYVWMDIAAYTDNLADAEEMRAKAGTNVWDVELGNVHVRLDKPEDAVPVSSGQ